MNSASLSIIYDKIYAALQLMRFVMCLFVKHIDATCYLVSYCYYCFISLFVFVFVYILHSKMQRVCIYGINYHEGEEMSSKMFNKLTLREILIK